jgi:hypothetical protein
MSDGEVTGILAFGQWLCSQRAEQRRGQELVRLP